MKTIFTLAIAFISIASFAQIKVSEKNVNIEGNKDGFFIEIPYGTSKQVDKALKKELKSWKGNYKGGKYHFVDDSKNKKMGDNTFDVYAICEENSDGGGNISVAIDLGGAFLNSGMHSDQFKLMEGILYEFAVKIAKDVVQEEVDEQEKILKTREKELSDLEKEQEKMEKEIEDFKKKIEQNEKAIEESKKNQETKKEEIKTQQGVVQEVIKKKEAVK